MGRDGLISAAGTSLKAKAVCVFVGAILLCLAAGGLTGAQEVAVSPVVREAMQVRGRADFFVVLRDDPAAAVLQEGRGLAEREDRHRFLVEQLQRRTFQSQNDLGYMLLQQGADYQHFWIVNQILVRNASPGLLQKIITRKDVARLDANPRVKLSLPEEGGKPLAPQAVGALQWNISNIKADQVWSTFGVTGSGVVVAVNDTGVLWTHEALQNQYRGWNGVAADHTYSWHDAIHTNDHGSNPCGVNAPAPCDDYGHGTHVTGIIAGQTLANQIGVAPGAKWIACRNMDNGYGTPATYLECLQWFLAPEGKTSQAPHIINNSWSCPPSEGCAQDTLEAAVQTVTAAGIMMVVSNGNNGPACASATEPPAIYRQSFSVGATDSSDALAGFSSRGPVTYKGETYLKPDISAPGVGIWSSYYNGGYTPLSGTSMAAPHISGAAALLWSGIPRLKGKVDATRQLLESTARPRDYTACGSPAGVPNNGYGYGIVNVLSAFRQGVAPSVSSYLFLLLD
jgi:serine protease AprX